MSIFCLRKHCFSEFCVSGFGNPLLLNSCANQPLPPDLHACGSALAELEFAAAAAPAPNAAEPTQPLCRDARASVLKQLSKRARRSKHALRTRGNTC